MRESLALHTGQLVSWPEAKFVDDPVCLCLDGIGHNLCLVDRFQFLDFPMIWKLTLLHLINPSYELLLVCVADQVDKILITSSSS